MTKKKATIQQELDTTLWSFVEKDSVFLDHVKLHFQQPTGAQKVLTSLVEQCITDGYLFAISADGVPIDRYIVSAKGLILLERGGYEGQRKRDQWLHRWTIAKTVGTIAYSLLVLGVAIWAVIVQVKAS